MSMLIDAEALIPAVPQAALLVFSNGKENYLELRPILRDGTMGAAKPVSKQFINELIAGFSKEYNEAPYGEIPENLLYCDTRTSQMTLIWYNPPMKRQRFFKEEIGLEDGTYHVPGTLYAVKNGKLHVYCFKGKKPKMTGKVLGVPYFNVYKNGEVCMGSARLRIPNRPTWKDVLLAWESAFWNSYDAHTNGSPSTKENLMETIREYKDKPFNTDALVENKNCRDIEGLIKMFTR